MPKPPPREFREDVVRVGRNRGPGQRLVSITRDFGIIETCLSNWLKTAEVEDGIKPGVTNEQNAELRGAKKRVRLPEKESEVLRRAAAYVSQANLPTRGSTPS